MSLHSQILEILQKEYTACGFEHSHLGAFGDMYTSKMESDNINSLVFYIHVNGNKINIILLGEYKIFNTTFRWSETNFRIEMNNGLKNLHMFKSGYKISPG